MSLQAHGIDKAFGPVHALHKVHVAFQPGEVHAVLGENGAGKSTLMHVIAGFVTPDAGEVTFDGQPLPLGSAFECRRRGIEMIHQHFALVPEFTVAENLALARLDRLGRPATATALAEPALTLARQLGWEFDGRARVNELPVGAQQRLEIVKALAGNARAIILDEPTAVLAPNEVQDLFRVLRLLRDQGRILVLIAHKLAEVLQIADRVTVLRRGRVVGQSAIDSVDERRLAEWMVGELPPSVVKAPAPSRDSALAGHDIEVLGDRGEPAVRGVSFSIDAGEVVGFGGVDGNGQVELAEVLAGVRQPRGGQIAWKGTRFDPNALEIGYIPQNRQSEGLVLEMSVRENTLLGCDADPDLVKAGFLRKRAIDRRARSLIERFEIRAPGPDVPVGRLSGGNQQKVVVARSLDRAPDLIVAVNPTRGLDVRAAAFVHRVLLEARHRGAAVALFTTDLDELFALSDRAYFMTQGRLRDAEDASAMVAGKGA